MLHILIFFVTTLLAMDFAPSVTNSKGVMWLLIATPLLLLLACIQKQLFKHPALLFSELFLLTLLFFYGIGMPHTTPTFAIYLIFYFLMIGLGLSWNMTLFLLPFSIPFLLFSATSEWLSPFIGETIFAALSLLLLMIVILLLPLFFQWIWRCPPLPSSPLKDRLDYLCRRFHFQHGGMLIWKVMKNTTTAAIIGIFPRFRYILFTESLLHTFPEEEIEAILAHEIGHAVHKHLLIYPFLFVGLFSCGFFLSPWIEQMPPLLGYLVYMALIILYVRYLIGFFSRNFERQADLHIFAFGLPANSLTTAFERISHLNFLPLKKKNWHHGSLADRISFLHKAEADSRLIKGHHRRVRYYLLTYLLINLTFWACWIFLN